jgi:hypothetical protein
VGPNGIICYRHLLLPRWLRPPGAVPLRSQLHFSGMTGSKNPYRTIAYADGYNSYYGHVHEPLRAQITASSPLRSMRFKSLSDGPLGFFSPTSHLRTVDRLVLSTEARTA